MTHAVNIGKQLDRIRRFLATTGTELEIYKYSLATGLVTVGKVLNSWLAYPDTEVTLPGAENRRLIIAVSESAAVSTTTLAAMMERPTHVRIGTLYYKINGVPESPQAALGNLAYWTIRCDPTGKSNV
jgi:hypothetical protein